MVISTELEGQGLYLEGKGGGEGVGGGGWEGLDGIRR
jgi:hypothetical protein